MRMANPDLARKYDLGNQLTVQFSLKLGVDDENDFLLVEFGPPGISNERMDEIFDVEVFKAALAHFEGEHMGLLKALYPRRYKAIMQ